MSNLAETSKGTENLKSLKPLTAEKEPRVWTLYYRYGNVPQLTKNFIFDGTLNDAIVRGRKHCELMSFRFIIVRPLIVDLDFQETQFMAGKYRDPSGEKGDI